MLESGLGPDDYIKVTLPISIGITTGYIDFKDIISSLPVK